MIWRSLRTAFYLNIGWRVVHKFNQIKSILPQFPCFEVGDLVVFDLSYATVVYRVEALKRYKKRRFYELKGVKILAHDSSNPYMTEARHYTPDCSFFDKEAQFYDGPL